jgi:hypothetical protein
MSNPQIAIRRRIDSRLTSGVWQPHYYCGPPRVTSQLARGMWYALLPAIAFWSAAALASYWLLAA